MARVSKLQAALDAQQGRDHRVEKQERMRKQASARKRRKLARPSNKEISDTTLTSTLEDPGAFQKIPPLDQSDLHIPSSVRQSSNRTPPKSLSSQKGLGPSNPKEVEVGNSLSMIIDGVEDEKDISFSDVESHSSDENADIVLHQKLTVNHIPALEIAHRNMNPPSSLPFFVLQSLTCASPVAISDVNDDLNRELAFYGQCKEAVRQARRLLKADGQLFSRPSDYFAEMVKTDEHMDKITEKLVHDAAGKKASHEAKRQRELRKFGKQIQVARQQERSRAKKATLDKINLIRKKTSGDSSRNNNDLFDVALKDEVAGKEKIPSSRKSRERMHLSREKRNEKFGFGGKKRFSKSGNTVSSGDLSKLSTKNMKQSKGKTKRSGKSRRLKAVK